MPDDLQINSKKAVAFLKALFPEKRINVVAIDPHNLKVTGITQPVSSDAVANFIEHHNGKRNLYYSVNTPTDDAPDNKLKKNHIKEINAVWLDADPTKCPEGIDEKEHFAQERVRLLKFAKDLMSGDNPPTVVTDSGGGIQAFWFLDKPVPVTEETRKHYEALSRGLADQYGTDRVQNIDRIMRIPYTINIPGTKKKGREKALAKSTTINPKRYLSLPFITPSEAEDAGNEIDYTKLDMAQVKLPMSSELKTKLAILRKRNQKIDDLWTNKIDMKPSRSERDFTLAKELKGEGCPLLETAIIMWNYPHGKVSSVKNPVREIVRCYERSGNEFAEGMDEETLERIAKQTNPLLKDKRQSQALIDNAQFISGGDAKIAGSGTPLFKHFLNCETVNVLFGPSGSGKSFLTLDMAMHLATGRDWAGFKCKQKMGVLYICTESGSSFGKRAVAARKKVEVKEGTLLKDFPFAYYPAHIDLLNNKDHIKLIMKLIDDLERQSDYKCGLVVVDTLSAAFGGGNENSEDMTKFVNNMAAIKFSKKLAVMVVHHTGKDESAGARGHSSLKGNVDTEIQVKSEKRGEKYYRSFVSTKQKDDETGNLKRFGLDIVKLAKDEDGDDITTCSVIVEGEIEFEAIAPSIEEGLDINTKCALKAIRFYHSIPGIENTKIQHTEKQIKAILFNDFKENKKVFEENDVTNALSQLDVMAKPDKTVLKAFERCCDTLATNGLTRENAKYQLFNQDYNTCDKDTT